MFKVIIDNYEEREKEFLVENQKLRKSLYDLHRDLRIHIKDYCAEQNPDLFVEEMVDLSGKDAMDYFMVGFHSCCLSMRFWASNLTHVFTLSSTPHRRKSRSSPSLTIPFKRPLRTKFMARYMLSRLLGTD
jgi:hypothetical protein